MIIQRTFTQPEMSCRRKRSAITRKRMKNQTIQRTKMIIVILLPFLGVFIYLITQGSHMAERDMRQAKAAQGEFDDYVKSVASSGSPAAEIERAQGLLSSGAITQAEFDAIKAKALAQG